MTGAGSWLYPFYRLLILCGLAAGLCSPARAAEIDPFQINSGHWMSFERYNDNIKRNRPVGAEALSQNPSAIEVPGTPAAAEDLPEPMTASNSSVAPAIAAPTRPLDLPFLPGINKGFNVEVNSTEDDNHSAPSAQIVRTNNGKADLHLREQNWQNAAAIARQHAGEINGAKNDGDHAPLDVRMTFLPNAKIAPETGPARKPRPRLTETPAPPKAQPATTPPAQQSPAECAAVDAYKKKQLEAIQSDRQTLQALQSAISDLGLQKELNFLSGAQQSPTLSGPAKTATP